MSEARIETLQEGFRDDTLTREECLELQDWLELDESRRAAFDDGLRLANALAALSVLDADEIAPAVRDCLSRARTTPDLSGSVRRRIEGCPHGPANVVEAARSGSGWMAPWTDAVVVTVVALLVFLTPQLRQDRGDAVATVRAAHGAPGVSVGERMRPGRFLELDRGRIKVVFGSGAILAVEAPARLEVLGPNSARLERGRVTIRVPGRIKGFVLHTPHERVTDLGTSFGVEVDTVDGTSISVFEGEVELGDDRRLVVGQAVEFESRGESPRDVPYDVHRFLETWQVSFGVEEVLGNVRVATPTERRSPGQVEDGGSLLLFPEREHVTLARGREVDAVEPGTHRRPFRRSTVKLAEGVQVDSFLLQYNPVRANGDTKNRRFVGELRFDRPIVALILQRDLLATSDSLLALPGSDFRDIFRRGLNDRDSVTLSPDRRTLQVVLDVKNGVDQIRVLVASDDSSNP